MCCSCCHHHQGATALLPNQRRVIPQRGLHPMTRVAPLDVRMTSRPTQPHMPHGPAPMPTGEAGLADAVLATFERLPAARWVITTLGTRGAMLLERERRDQGQGQQEASTLEAIIERLQQQLAAAAGGEGNGDGVSCVSSSGVRISAGRVASTPAAVGLSYSGSRWGRGGEGAAGRGAGVLGVLVPPWGTRDGCAWRTQSKAADCPSRGMQKGSFRSPHASAVRTCSACTRRRAATCSPRTMRDLLSLDVTPPFPPPAIAPHCSYPFVACAPVQGPGAGGATGAGGGGARGGAQCRRRPRQQLQRGAIGGGRCSRCRPPGRRVGTCHRGVHCRHA